MGEKVRVRLHYMVELSSQGNPWNVSQMEVDPKVVPLVPRVMAFAESLLANIHDAECLSYFESMARLMDTYNRREALAEEEKSKGKEG